MRKKFETQWIPARSLPCHNCAKLIDFLKNILLSEDFPPRHKTSPAAFTCNRKLTFSVLILFFVNMVKGSCQDELDHFFKVLTGLKTVVRAVTKAALTKARKKLRHEVFIELSQNVVRFFYGNFPHRTWLGYVLLAMDGSTMKVPETEENAIHFGTFYEIIINASRKRASTLQ